MKNIIFTFVTFLIIAGVILIIFQSATNTENAVKKLQDLEDLDIDTNQFPNLALINSFQLHKM